jgi:hypothetical protein
VKRALSLLNAAFAIAILYLKKKDAYSNIDINFMTPWAEHRIFRRTAKLEKQLIFTVSLRLSAWNP